VIVPPADGGCGPDDEHAASMALDAAATKSANTDDDMRITSLLGKTSFFISLISAQRLKRARLCG